MKCQHCGGPVYGDNIICDKCRYDETDKTVSDYPSQEADELDDWETNELFSD